MTAIAIVKWGVADGIATVIGDELARLGYRTSFFLFDNPIPEGVEVVFSFAPYGRFLQIPRQVSAMQAGRRPKFVHWSTENPPDLQIPWPVMSLLSRLRSWVGRLGGAGQDLRRRPMTDWLLRPLEHRMHNFRYLGDYVYAHRQGWIDVLAEASQVYSRFFNSRGLPAVFVPWGTAPLWYEDLGLERDIDVLWMGKRRNRRRSGILDAVRQQVSSLGLHMHVADGIDNPFIFGQERTRYLNRSKITLNVHWARYANVLHFRFCMAAPNRSLVVSDPTLPHSPAIEAGRHYVSAAPGNLVKTIVHYLERDDERQRIVENAFQLATRQLTLGNSVKTIMAATVTE